MLRKKAPTDGWLSLSVAVEATKAEPAAAVAVVAAVVVVVEVNKEGEAFSSCCHGTADSKGDGKMFDGIFEATEIKKIPDREYLVEFHSSDWNRMSLR